MSKEEKTIQLNNPINVKEDDHIISLLVNNKPGVLIRISLVFSRRGYNIDSLVTHPTQDPQFSMMTICASGDEKSLSLILKQLRKLVDVIDAKDRSKDSVVTQELALIKCTINEHIRSEVLLLAQSFECTIIDITDTSIIFNCVGDAHKLDALEKIFTPFGIIESIRTGSVVMLRGEHPTSGYNINHHKE